MASVTTVWRALEKLTPGGLDKIAKVRAQVRAHVWKRIEAGGDLGEVTVIRLDASIVLAHSDKQRAGRDPPLGPSIS